jgi:hypothetical protein
MIAVRNSKYFSTAQYVLVIDATAIFWTRYIKQVHGRLPEGELEPAAQEYNEISSLIAARVAAQESITVRVIDATRYISNDFMEGYQWARFRLNYYII